MSKKIYKGYQLMKAIADGEIEEGSRFKVKALWNGSYVYDNRIAIVKYKNIVYEEEEIITSWTIINSEFELIEDETIDIESIEELDNTCYDINNMTDDEIECYHNYTRSKINIILQWAKQQEKRIKKLEDKQ